MECVEFLCSLFILWIKVLSVLYLSDKTIEYFSTPNTDPRQIATRDAFGQDLNPGSGTPSPFLRLPRELRDIVYRMLLTTCYTYTEALIYNDRKDSHGWLHLKGSFNLHTAILRANKQIAEEARNTLYNENDFVIFKACLLPWDRFDNTKIPAFWGLDAEKIAAPALKITLGARKLVPKGLPNWLCLVTTLDAMPLLVRTMWRFLETKTPKSEVLVSFLSKGPSQYALLHDKGLEPLKQLHGLGEISVGGNMKASDLKTLWHCMTTKPQPEEVMRNLKTYQEEAVACFGRMDYTAAWSFWVHMRNYWRFCFDHNQRRSMFEGLAVGDLKSIWAIMLEANFGQVKVLIHLGHYKAVKECARYPMGCIISDLTFNTSIDPLLHAKMYFCRGLASMALGKDDDVRWLVKEAADLLFRVKHVYSPRQEGAHLRPRALTRDALIDDLYWALNDHLRRNTSSQQVGSNDWQLPIGYRSFWDWMEVSRKK